MRDIPRPTVPELLMPATSTSAPCPIPPFAAPFAQEDAELARGLLARAEGPPEAETRSASDFVS